MIRAASIGIICLVLGCGEDGSSTDDASPPVIKLAFTVQPTNGEAASPLAPVSVAFVDELGHVVTTESGPITIALPADAPPNLLGGSTVVTASEGIATFDQLVIQAPASHLVLEARANAGEIVTSDSFDVRIGEPSGLSTLAISPATAVADGLGEASVTVTLRNAGGLVIPSYPVMVSASGTHNTWAPSAGGMTNAQGQLQLALRSTLAEAKTVTATAGVQVLTDSVTFTPAPCTPLLGGLPSTLMPDYIRTLRAADVDGDGHVDLAFAETTSLVIMRGLGNGRFRAAERYATGTDTFAVAAGDFDNDNDVDFIVVRRMAGELIPFTNMGNGTLVKGTAVTLASPYAFAVEVIDLDGDNALDVIVRTDTNIFVLRGLGNGTFQTPTMYPLPIQPASNSQAWLAIADLNNDGHLDVVTSDTNSQYDVLLGASGGTLQALPAVYTGEYLSVALGDLDGDGYADLAYGLSWKHGNGDGTFGTSTDLSPFRRATFAQIADVNGDGHLDILGGAGDYAPYALDVVLGNGNGTFQRDQLRALNFIPQTAALADFDEDGRVDVAVGADFSSTYHAISILLGSATSTLPGVTFHGEAIGPNRALFSRNVADFDSNGTLDFVALNTVTYGLGIQLSATDLSLTAMPTVSNGSGPEVEVADFNGDNHPDVVWANGSQLQWLRGRGDGTLDNPVATTTPRLASALKAVDLDGNGVLDLVMVNQANAMIIIALGNGDGTFGSFVGYAVGTMPRQVDADDLDNDGDQDLIVANSGSSSISVLLNQGNGTFSAATTYGMAGVPYWVTAADLDGDGKRDLAVANGSAANRVIFYKGHGNGTFDPAVSIPAGLPTSWIAVTDVDADGIPDLIATFRGLVVLRGNGNGTFKAPLFYDLGGAGAATVRDFNGDGQPDIMIPQTDPGVGFLLSRGGGCG